MHEWTGTEPSLGGVIGKVWYLATYFIVLAALGKALVLTSNAAIADAVTARP